MENKRDELKKKRRSGEQSQQTKTKTKRKGGALQSGELECGTGRDRGSYHTVYAEERSTANVTEGMEREFVEMNT